MIINELFPEGAVESLDMGMGLRGSGMGEAVGHSPLLEGLLEPSEELRSVVGLDRFDFKRSDALQLSVEV